MSTETVTETITETKPKLRDGSGNDDDRLRHIVEKKRPDSRSYKKIALCGAKVKDVHVEQNGEICQACVDELKRRQG
jgi:hypothetical protein